MSKKQAEEVPIIKARQLAIYQAKEVVPAPRLDSCSTAAWQLLDSSLTNRHLSRFMKNKIPVLFWIQSVIMCLSFLFSQPWTYKRIILRAVKVFTSCTKFVQAICDRRHSFALVHHSCEEVVVYVHRRVLWPSIFLIFIVDELKNFVANNLF